MSRQHRIQFPNAIYHVTSRGNRRQDIVHDDQDRDQFWERLGNAVRRFGWDLFAASLMTNHFHPELARRGSRHVARPAFASLARRHTAAKLRELAGWLGVSRRDCVPNVAAARRGR